MDQLFDILFQYNRRTILPEEYKETIAKDPLAEVYLEENAETRIQVLTLSQRDDMYSAFCYDSASERVFTYTLAPTDELIVLY